MKTKQSNLKCLPNRGSESGKTSALQNLITHQPDSDKICLYAKDLYEVKYQYLFNKREKVCLKHYDDFKVSIRYSNDMQDVYEDIEEYNPSKRHTVLILFDDMIADMVSYKKINPIVTEVFIRILIFRLFLLHKHISNHKSCQTKFFALFYYQNSK